MNVPTVSVIIPCYNSERFIRTTLESILAQDFADMDVVAVDDGSTDNTSDILAEYEQIIRVIRGPNRGVSSARNIGTWAAKGRYIQYVDSDDLLVEGTVAARISELEKSHADVAYTDWQYFEEGPSGRYEKGAIVRRSIESMHEDAEIALFTNFWAPPAAYLYRREIVERIGGWNERLPVIQDARFAFDAAFHGGKFIHVKGVGAYYRRHRKSGLSRTNYLKFETDVLINALEVEGMWARRGNPTSGQRKALFGVYNYVARPLFFRDEKMFTLALRGLYRYERGFTARWPKVVGMLAKIFGFGVARRIVRIMKIGPTLHEIEGGKSRQ